MTVHKLEGKKTYDTADLSRQLLERFVIETEVGSSRRYYDLQTDQGGLLEGNVIGALLYINDSTDYKTYSQTLQMNKHSMRYLVHNKTVYKPNAAKVINVKGLNYLNSWKDDGIKAYPVTCLNEARTLCKPFLHFLELALKDDAALVLEQLALLVQEPLPAVKRPIAVYLFAAAQGQGKSLTMNVMSKILGSSSIRLAGGRSLRDQNIVQLFDRTLTVIDEADLKVKGQLYETLKHLITESKTEAALKHQAMRTLPTPAQLFMLSNNPPSFLDPADRRFLVCEFDTGLRGAEKDLFFNELVDWLENQEGYSKVAALLSLYDTSTYDRAAAAPLTDTKRRILGSFNEGFTEDLKDYMADEKLRVIDVQDPYLSSLQSKYDLTAKQLVHAINEAGFSKHPDRLKIKGTYYRLYHSHQDRIYSQSGKAAYVINNQGDKAELSGLLDKYPKDSARGWDRF